MAPQQLALNTQQQAIAATSSNARGVASCSSGGIQNATGGGSSGSTASGTTTRQPQSQTKLEMCSICGSQYENKDQLWDHLNICDYLGE